MNVEKNNLERSEIELNVELSLDEFRPYIEQGAKKVSKEVKIDGFRPGQVPYEVLKQKIGEMSILEESARIAINKTLPKVIDEHVEGQPVGQPRVDITKLAPDNAMSYKVVVALLPDVKLGDYKDLKIKDKEVKVDDKEVERMLDDLKNMRGAEKLVAREIKDGDKAMVDIQMYLDKVPVEGGQSQDTAVAIGKEYIVPGFDKQLLGAKKGDVKEFTLPYPQDFHMQNLAGKKVEFKVTVKDVYEIETPQLDDKFAQGFGMKNLEDLKKNVKSNIEQQKQQEVRQQVEREMLDKIIEKTKFGDIPQVLVEHESDVMISELEHTVSQQGAKFEDYLASLGKTKDQLALDMMPDAVKRVKVSLLIREVAEAEKMQATKEEIDEHIEHMKGHYKDNQDILSRLDSQTYRDYASNVLTSKKVIDKLMEWNVVKK